MLDSGKHCCQKRFCTLVCAACATALPSVGKPSITDSKWFRWPLQVHRVLQNYTESKEAAYRAIKVDAGPFPALSLALSSFHADADTLSRDERLANLRHATQRVENSRNVRTALHIAWAYYTTTRQILYYSRNNSVASNVCRGEYVPTRSNGTARIAIFTEPSVSFSPPHVRVLARSLRLNKDKNQS